jgi:hypothetical protein
MCIVSNIGDYWKDSFIERYPGVTPWGPTPLKDQVSRFEFDRLAAEVRQLRELLMRAKAFDEHVGEPDCAMDDKVQLIRQIADQLGVDMSKVFPAQGLTAHGSGPITKPDTGPIDATVTSDKTVPDQA